jgi:hypothetical protein
MRGCQEPDHKPGLLRAESPRCIHIYELGISARVRYRATGKQFFSERIGALSDTFGVVC